MMRRSRRIRLGRRSLIEVDVEGGGDQGAEVEVVVVVSGVGGEGVVGEVSRKRMQTKRERRDAVRIVVVMEMPEGMEYDSPKSSPEFLLIETAAGMENGGGC